MQVDTDAHTGTLLQKCRQAGRKDADVSRKTSAQTLHGKDSRITGPRWERGREGSCWVDFWMPMPTTQPGSSLVEASGQQHKQQEEEKRRRSSTQALLKETHFLWHRLDFLAKQHLHAFTSVSQISIAQKQRLVKGFRLCTADNLDRVHEFSRQIWALSAWYSEY